MITQGRGPPDDLEGDGGAEHFAMTIRRDPASARPAHDDRDPDPRFPEMRPFGAGNPWSRRSPMSSTTISKTGPRPLSRGAPGARLFPTPSLRLLQRVKELDPTMFTKSGIMVGLGEEPAIGAAGDGRHARRRMSIP